MLDAFESTWSNARSTFGEGTPQTGAQYDGSAKLTELQNTVNTAAPDSRWTGSASAAYGAANLDHARVLGQLAGLDQRLGAAVDQSAQVVANGRQNLDAVRNWVMAAATAVPPGANRDQMLLPIVQKGLSQITDIVTTSNGDLSKIGGQIRLVGNQYELLKDQRFAPEKGGGDPDLQNVKGDEKPAGADQAAKDWNDIRAGTATPEQVARVRAAATLTPEQTGALQQGKPAVIDQGQYDYLKGLMRAQDGMSAAEINKTLDKYPDLKGAMGDAYRIMGNPNVQAPDGEHGGIGNEPKKIQSLLNDDLKYQTGSRPGSGQVPMVPLNQFNALNDMLGHGNPDLRAGSDVDRALLNESARIADLIDQGHPVYSDTPDARGGHGAVPFAITDTHDINNTLNGMVDNASGDHQAVTDFLTGANDPNSVGAQRMGAATLGHFGGNDAFLDLTTHKFDQGQAGVQHMFDWMGKNAYTPGLEGYDAAASANATSHLLANNHEFLTRMPDGHGGYQALGQVNPELTRTLTANLSPYIGNLDGVKIPGINADAIPGFTDVKDMSNMFQVLDTDPASAEALNNVVAQWEQHFAYEYGLTGDAELGRHAGQLTQAMENGNHSALDALRTNQNWDAIRAYQDRAAHWDTTKTILSDIAGMAPGGTWATKLGDLAAPYVKDDVLGIPGDPGKMDPAQWDKALTATDQNFNHLIDGRIREYNIAQGYLDAHPGARAQFENAPGTNGPVNLLDENGQIDWDKVKNNERAFNWVMDRPELSDLKHWGDANHGYESGLEDTNIDPQFLPDPSTGPGDAPGR